MFILLMADVEWAVWHPKGNAVLAGSADGTAWMWLAHNGQCVQVKWIHRTIVYLFISYLLHVHVMNFVYPLFYSYMPGAHCLGVRWPRRRTDVWAVL
jgi:hypothetical protein